MHLPSDGAARWLEYSDSAIRLLLAIQAGQGEDGYTAPMTGADLQRAARIKSRTTFFKAVKELLTAGEIEQSFASAYHARYRLCEPCVQKMDTCPKNGHVSKNETDVQKMDMCPVDAQTEEAQTQPSTLGEPSDGESVQKMDTCSKNERRSPVLHTKDTSPVLAHDPEKQEGGDTQCVSQGTPPAADALAWSRLTVRKLQDAVRQGDIPRDRLLEVAAAEEWRARQENRAPRSSFVQEAVEMAYQIPAAQFRPMVMAICAAFGFQVERLTNGERGAVHATASELCKAGYKPEDVATIYRYCKRQKWSGGFKPTALLNHASAAMAARNGGNNGQSATGGTTEGPAAAHGGTDAPGESSAAQGYVSPFQDDDDEPGPGGILAGSYRGARDRAPVSRT